MAAPPGVGSRAQPLARLRAEVQAARDAELRKPGAFVKLRRPH